MTDPASEGAKAAQEIAKTTGKGIDAAREAGGFIAKYIHGPLEQASAIWTDKLKYTRWERQVALMQRANSKLAELGMSQPTQAIPLKIAIPLLQEGSMEEDDYLQDRWANLLVNAANADSGIEVRATYIGMLREMTSLDVRILASIYSHPVAPGRKGAVWIGDLPNSTRPAHELDDMDNTHPELPEDVALSVENLQRLGCIAPWHGFAGSIYYNRMLHTALVTGFVRACSFSTKRRPQAVA
jgi:hypothetical protein